MNALRMKGTYAGKEGARGLVRAKRSPLRKGRSAPVSTGTSPKGLPNREYLVGRSFGHQGLNRAKFGKLSIGPKVKRQIRR